MDLRLLRYMLAVPAMPWCRVKYLQRQAMRGILPEPVRRRRKTILRGDPVWDTLKGSKLPDLGVCPANPSVCILQAGSGISRPGPNIFSPRLRSPRLGLLVPKQTGKLRLSRSEEMNPWKRPEE